MVTQYVTCPHCEGRSQVDASIGNVNFRCPHCQGVMSLAKSSTPTRPPTSSPENFRCPSCEGRFRLPTEFRGNLIKCPHCQQRVRVPANVNDRHSKDVADLNEFKIETQPDRHKIRVAATRSRDKSETTSPNATDETFEIAVGDEKVRIQNQTKTVDYRGATLRVRELSRSEKNQRRRLRNIVVGAVALGVLIATALILLRV